MTASPFADRAPRWLTLVAGVGLIGVGAVLTLRPFTSLEVLLWVAALGALVMGLGGLFGPEGSDRRRVVLAALWLGVAAFILGWPDVSADLVSTVVGLGLVGHGVIEIVGVVRREQYHRPLWWAAANLVNGLSAIVVGVVAMSWPDATVFVVAILFGVSIVRLGISSVIATFARRRDVSSDAGEEPVKAVRPNGVVALRHLVGFAAAIVLALISIALRGDTPDLDPMYDTALAADEPPGTLLAAEPYASGVPDGSQGWLIAYNTTDSTGDPGVATAVVMASDEVVASNEPAPLVAWTHGTVGIDRHCAPSLSDPINDMAAMHDALDAGWVIVATDYLGMGTPGVSPYLVGAGQAYSALDSVRAAQQFDDVKLDGRTAVWGHSQGGHAALWTGQLAATYAPELDIVGVAALSPATELVEMAKAVGGQPGGALVSSYVISTYADTYSDVDFNDYVRAGARASVIETAKRCLTDPGLLVSIISSLPMTQEVLAIDPSNGPAGERLAENRASADVSMPVLVAQGTADEVIPFDITERWAEAECAAGHRLDLRSYAGRTHMSVLAPDSPLNAELMAWTQARLEGAEPTPTC